MPFLPLFFLAIYLWKKPGCLSYRISYSLGFLAASLCCLCVSSIHHISYKLIFKSWGVIRFKFCFLVRILPRVLCYSKRLFTKVSWRWSVVRVVGELILSELDRDVSQIFNLCYIGGYWLHLFIKPANPVCVCVCILLCMSFFSRVRKWCGV